MKQQESKFKFNYILNLGYYERNYPDLDTKTLINQLYKIQEEEPSGQKSNKGGYQTMGNLNFRFEFAPLVNFLNFAIFELIGDPNIKIVSMWGNISSFTNSNAIHTHTDKGNFKQAEQSGILYLNTPPNSGELIFYNPLFINQTHKFIPKEKDLVLFHSSIPHSVSTNLSQEDRISIAFNFE